MTEASYFVNHGRRERFPWWLYHRENDFRVARALEPARGGRVLVVGCGLDPNVRGLDALFYGSDLDPRAIDACRSIHPEMADRLGVCPSPYEQPAWGFAFDGIVAKEVVEHTHDPGRWARSLTGLLRPGGTLVLTTPNYGRWSTLPVLEQTVLEWVARRDGFSRKEIHPSRFDKRRLAELDVGETMRLVRVEVTSTRWALVGVWEKLR